MVLISKLLRVMKTEHGPEPTWDYRKHLLLFLMIGLLSAPVLLSAANAKKEAPLGWKKELVGNLNISQNSFDNWSQGGSNMLAWQLNLNGHFVENRKQYSWANHSKLVYGMSRIAGSEARKSVDEIKLGTVYTRKLGIHVNPYVSLKLDTQFTNGYKYKDTTRTKISNFMDPGYFVESFGAGWAASKWLKTRVGFALKQTITRDFPKPYADNPATPDEIEKIKSEMGFESVIDLKTKLHKNILLTSKLELFSNLDALNQTDVQWDTVFNTKISKFICVNLNVKLYYDRDVSPRRQIKQALALGFTYSFI